MGSSASKATSTTKSAAKTASQLSSANTARKYPTRPPPTSSPRTNVQHPRPSPVASVAPAVRPDMHASSARGQSINLDASDSTVSQTPQSQNKNHALSARLQQLGPVQPNPTHSNSSTFNTSSLSSPNSPLRTSPSHQQPPSIQAQQFQPSSSTPSQTIFPSRASNPAVSLLTARYRLAEDAQKEFEQTGRRGAKGRSFLDVVTLRQVLVMREKGISADKIESNLELRPGVVGRLGNRGVVEAAGLD